MFVKICYGPLQYLTVLDVKTVDFTSHLQNKVYFVKDSPVCFVEADVDYASDVDFCIYTNDEYLKNNTGCSSKGPTDNEWYLNTLNITRNDGETLHLAFTGTAYLCNETGRTVDTFR